MGHRLSKIVTRTGDAGTTGLGDGSRVAKDSARIAAIGEVDELNSTIGLLLTESLPAPVVACLPNAQHDIFDLGGVRSPTLMSRASKTPSRRSMPISDR